jgi:hypothetical protein
MEQVPKEAQGAPKQIVWRTKCSKPDVDGCVEARTYRFNPVEGVEEPIVEIAIKLPVRAKTKTTPAFLHTFFVLPRKREGSKEFKGVGKKALCLFTNELVKKEFLKRDDVIELEAVPSTDPTASTLTCEAQTRTLVAYYETYGFKVVPGKEDEGNGPLMRGTIEGILQACSTTGGKKRRACSGGYTRRRGPGGRARTKTLRRRRGIRR